MAEELLITLGVQDKNATAQIRALSNNIRSLDNQIKIANTGMKGFGTTLSGLQQKYGLFTTQMKNMQTQLRSYKTKLAEANEGIQRQQALLAELSARGEENSTAYARAASSLDKYRAQANDTQNKISELEGRIANLNQQIAQTETLMGNFSLLRFGEQAVQIGQNFQNTGQKIQNVGKGLQTVGTTISTLSAPFAMAAVGAAKAAISYEDAFAGVRKTVDGTETELNQLSDAIRDMAKEMPTSATEIAAVAEAAGQLGIETPNVAEFTKVMVMLGDTTNMSATEAATQLARLANITGMSASEYSNLGSTIVDLGNNFATTEGEITTMALRLAGAGAQVGMSEAQILGFATALSSVGIEAEAGGSAFSKVMVNMQLACVEGGEALEEFASVAGMSADDFKTKFETDAAGAILAFIDGLANVEENGGSAIEVLDKMGISEVRLRDALLRAAGGADIFQGAIDTANKSWEENSALTEEAAKRYETVQSKIEILKNKIYDLGISLGEKLLPYIEEFIDWAADLVEWFGNLDEGTQQWIIKLGLLGTAVGAGVTLLGKFVSGIGSVTSGIGSVIEIIGRWALKQAGVSVALSGTTTALGGMSTAASTAAGGLASVSTKASILSTICNPLTLGIGALVTAIAAIGIAWYSNEKKCEAGAQQLREAGFVAEDLTGKVKGTANALDELFGHEYNIKFSDEYKTKTQEIENNVRDWHDRLVELQKNIDEILNNTEIDQDTKQEQVQAIVQPWIDELNQGNEEIATNQQELYNNVEQYAASAFGRGSEYYQEFMSQYESNMTGYKYRYDKDNQELLGIYEKLASGEMQMTDELRDHIMDVREDMANAQKMLNMETSDDYINQLVLMAEQERVIGDGRVENIRKSTDDIIKFKRQEADSWAEEEYKKIDALKMSGAITQEEYDRAGAAIKAQEENMKLLGETTANNYGVMAMYSKEFADQHGLHTQQVEGDIEGLFQVYDENGNAMRTVFATNEEALKLYAQANGGACKTVTGEWGEMTQVVVDQNGNIIAQLTDNNWAWENNAQAVCSALKTEIDSVKLGSQTTDQAMETIKSKLASGELSAQQFGFTTEEAFLECAREALNCQGDVDALKRSVGSLPKTTTITVTDNGTVKDVQWKIDGIKGKSVTVTVNQVAGTVVQHTRGGSWTINEQGTHGQVGQEQLARFNESWRGSKSWELIDGPYVDLGYDGQTSKALLGVGASIKSNATSTDMMLKAVQESVQRQFDEVYLDYANRNSQASQLAFNFGNPQQIINNNSTFDASDILDAIYGVVGAITGINLNPTVSLNPKGMAKVLTPYIDKELDIRSKRR